ncbi:MAG: 3-oxoacyl-(acyl-carrier-protein) synthase 2 [Firmicutes bacterium ADurb.Bin419]|nr:MAG: 3-oxoacyl-(acyl-carrier-protein) synthase 2 [Firmicutes bacterium ADurb.Bin419]
MYKKSGIYITGFDICIKEYGESIESLAQDIPYAIARRLDDFSLMLMQAAKNAIKDSGLTDIENQRCGAVFSTFWGPLKSTETFFLSLIKEGAENVSPAIFPNLVTNAALGQVCKVFRILNSTSTLIATAPVEYAMELMRKKGNQYMLIAECDELFETNIGACVSAGILDQNDLKFKDTNLKCAGGYAAFVLQQIEDLHGYNGKIYAKLLSSASIYAPMIINQLDVDITAERFELTAKRALEEAEVSVNEVGSIISFSNGSKNTEEIEKKAMSAIFGERASELRIIKPKNETGEVFGEGSSIAIKAGIDLINDVSYDGAAIMCCSFTPGNNINVTLLSEAKN